MFSKLRRTKSRGLSRPDIGGSGSVARERLYHALNQDRYDLLAPGVVDALRREVLATVSRHLEVENDLHELEIRRMDDHFYLVASVRLTTLPRLAAVS